MTKVLYGRINEYGDVVALAPPSYYDIYPKWWFKENPNVFLLKDKNVENSKKEKN